MAQPPRTHEDYQIGVICALATEMAAMVAMLDETHPNLKKEKGDENDYTLGRIGVHDIVIACLPAGLMGNGPAAIIARDMQRSFPIKFGLMVGVGGGVWSKKDDIRLGDVVVSHPTGTHGGVVQWDFGKMEKNGKFYRTGSLDKPPPVLLHALQRLKVSDELYGINLEESLSLIRNKPRMAKKYGHQGIENDILFKSIYDHEGDETCDGCNIQSIIQRQAREDTAPRIHYGNIASGNEVMKNGTIRDKVAKEEGVICFEMEAAGLMDNFRCLVIRGICDYADSHKNKRWQPYAAATAAAFARALLRFVDGQEVIKTVSREQDTKDGSCSSDLRLTDPRDDIPRILDSPTMPLRQLDPSPNDEDAASNAAIVETLFITEPCDDGENLTQTTGSRVNNTCKLTKNNNLSTEELIEEGSLLLYSSAPTLKNLSSAREYFNTALLNAKDPENLLRTYRGLLQVELGIAHLPTVPHMTHIIAAEDYWEKANKAARASSRLGDLSRVQFDAAYITECKARLERRQPRASAASLIKLWNHAFESFNRIANELGKVENLPVDIVCLRVRALHDAGRMAAKLNGTRLNSPWPDPFPFYRDALSIIERFRQEANLSMFGPAELKHLKWVEEDIRVSLQSKSR